MLSHPTIYRNAHFTDPSSPLSVGLRRPTVPMNFIGANSSSVQQSWSVLPNPTVPSVSTLG